MKITKTAMVLVTSVSALALMCGACGGSGTPTGVATLAGHTTTSRSSGTAGKASKQAFQDAMLEFSRCMRQHGVDMPDPTFSSDGEGGVGLTVKAPTNGTGPGGPDNSVFAAADKACQPIMDKAEQSMPKPSAEEEAKMRDGALKWARCMRAHGVDVPDPTFDASGKSKVQVRTHASSSSDTGGDTVGGPSGGPTAAGPKDDPKFQAAMKACQTKGGPGGPGPGLHTEGSR
jgi:hypothetical protein